MTTHIAQGLGQLGLAVTPKSVEEGFAVLGASFRTTEEFAPPDSYASGIEQLRKQLPKPLAAPDHRPCAYAYVDKDGVPDPYAAALEQMKTETNR